MYHLNTFVLIIALVIISFPLAADSTDIHENAGTRAMTFLKIGVGAKAMGMAESQVAATDDLYATYWNPAGLSRLQQPQLALMHNEWFAGINQEYIGFGFPFTDSNVIGISANFLSYGELQGRDQEGNETTIFRPYDLAASFSYARSMGEDLAFGLTAKLLREQIDDQGGSGFAFDIGGLYDLRNIPLSIGFNAQNIGPRVQYVEDTFLLPFIFRIGTSYRLWNDNLILTMDFIRPTDNDNAISVGCAYTIAKVMQIRTGYKHIFGGNDLGATSGLAGGFGVTLLRFQVDYALIPLGVLGLTHRFSLIANF